MNSVKEKREKSFFLHFLNKDVSFFFKYLGFLGHKNFSSHAIDDFFNR